MIGIYKITSPSKKVYIGQSVDIERRKKDYRVSLKKAQIKLYNSFKKYGYESHVFEVIIECDVNDLNNLERYYQDSYNSIEGGLNCRYTASDDRSGKLSKETIQKLKNKDFSYLKGNEFRTGIPHTDETKKQISKSLIGLMAGDKNPMYGMNGSKNKFFGKNHSDKTKDILRQKALLKTDVIAVLKSYNEERKIIILDTQNGIFYESISEASRMLTINKTTLKAYIYGKLKNKTNLIKA